MRMDEFDKWVRLAETAVTQYQISSLESKLRRIERTLTRLIWCTAVGAAIAGIMLTLAGCGGGGVAPISDDCTLIVEDEAMKYARENLGWQFDNNVKCGDDAPPLVVFDEGP